FRQLSPPPSLPRPPGHSPPTGIHDSLLPAPPLSTTPPSSPSSDLLPPSVPEQSPPPSATLEDEPGSWPSANGTEAENVAELIGKQAGGSEDAEDMSQENEEGETTELTVMMVLLSACAAIVSIIGVAIMLRRHACGGLASNGSRADAKEMSALDCIQTRSAEDSALQEERLQHKKIVSVAPYEKVFPLPSPFEPDDYTKEDSGACRGHAQLISSPSDAMPQPKGGSHGMLVDTKI
ncbi:hypothetical protein CYMTET_51728, partial [Cymbomonas tetramitiformis]